VTLLEILGIDLPIIQAPMAGVSSPELAAEVSNSGALGSIGVGGTDAEGGGDHVPIGRFWTDICEC
jgi:nitronate monooxygenase